MYYLGYRDFFYWFSWSQALQQKNPARLAHSKHAKAPAAMNALLDIRALEASPPQHRTG